MMDTCRPVKLRWMHGEALNPREIDDHHLSAEGYATQVFKTNERVAGCRLQTQHNRGAKDVIALVHWDKWAVILEPRVENVTVAASFSQQRNVRIPAPVNVSPNPYYGTTRVFLRPEDIIEFSDQHLTIEIVFAEDRPPELGAEFDLVNENGVASEVQVKSSNFEPETAARPNEEETSDTEDETDLDKPLTARSAQTPDGAETTPDPSRPTQYAIKETPSHIRSHSVIASEDEPYSTARDAVPEDAETAGAGGQFFNVDAESPSLRPQQRSNAENSQLRAGEDLARTVDSTPSDPIEEVERSGQEEVGISYDNGRSGRGIPERGLHHEEVSDLSDLPDIDPLGRVATYADGSADSDVLESEQPVAPTSEPLDEHQVATAAATRTVPKNPSKRKHSAEDVEIEQHAMELSQKKQKFDEAFPTTDTTLGDGSRETDGDEDGNDNDDEDEDEQSVISEPKSSMMSLEKGKRLTRRQKQTHTQESAEEIAVAAKKSSPEVVVKRSRVSSTPSSSANSSALTGKIPKILLSSESAVQKTPAVKKWLKNTGAAIIDTVPSKPTHFVCVVTKEHSLKSAKVLHSLALGKLVVTDDWVTDSKVANELLDPAEFVHKSLEDNITHDRSRIFTGMHLFFTKALVANYKSGWADIQEVAKAAGAIEVDRVPFNKPTLLADSTNVVFFGSEKADNDVSLLINEHDRTVYSKDLFTHSIISGELVLDDDEYKLTGSLPGKRRRS